MNKPISLDDAFRSPNGSLGPLGSSASGPENSRFVQIGTEAGFGTSFNPNMHPMRRQCPSGPNADCSRSPGFVGAHNMCMVTRHDKTGLSTANVCSM
jgi:hypothetical protein